MKDGRPPDDDDKVTPFRRFGAATPGPANDDALMARFAALTQEHSDLDAAIQALETQPHHDRLAVARLKKKKLHLKDQLQIIKDQLTPDIIA
jgi:hypothetical protein